MTTSKLSIWTFLLLFLTSLILVAHLLFDFITPIVLATVIVSIFGSFYERLLRGLKGRDYLAALIATILVCLLVLIPIALFFVALAQQGLMLFYATQRLTSTTEISNWMTALRNYLDSINRYLADFGISLSSDRILNSAASITQAIGSWLYDSIGLIASNLLALLLNIILTVALVFVFFVSGREIKQFLMDLVPLPATEKERLIKRYRELAYAVFVGNGLISVCEGILGGFSFFVFEITGALLWGFVMAITAFLPLIGSMIVVIPAGVYLFLVGKTWQAIVFLSFNFIQLSILESIVKPKLIGTRSQMSAVLVFMAVFAGVHIYGAFGLFYGPLLMTIFLALADIYKEHYREQLHRL